MADEEQEHDEAETTNEAPKKGGRGLFRIIKALAFISVIVVVQVVVASMMMPSAKDTEKLAKELVAASENKDGEHQEAAKGEENANAEHEGELEEIELGVYNVTRFNPGTNTTLAIDFEVYATVLASEVPEFEKRFEKSKARIREQITLTMHAAESRDLTDAGLGLIKRQILEKTNRALGQPLVKEVLFSKFNFVER